MTEKRGGTGVKTFQALLRVVSALQAEKDLDRLLNLILSSITPVLGAERSTLFLYDPQRHELYDKIAQKSEVKEIRIPVGKGIAGTVAETLKAVNIPDAYADPRFDGATDRKTGWRTRSILAVPLLTHEGRLVGVIEVLNKKRGSFDETDQKVLEAFSTNAAIALDNAFLVQQYVEKKRIEQQIEIARTIQLGLLPKEFPAGDGLDFAAHLEPCENTSGDYYDVFEAAHGRLIFVIADVTSHGIGPALIMSETRAFIRALAETLESPDRILTKVNHILAGDLTGGHFVTCFVGLFDPASGELSYANAGHDNVFIRRAQDGSVILLEATGMPLGILDDCDYPAGSPVCLKAGDILIMSTDGFVEAFDPSGQQMFGFARLSKVVDENASQKAGDVIRTIVQAVKNHSGQNRPADDQTILILKYTA